MTKGLLRSISLITLIVLCSACISIQKKYEANVTPELDNNLDEDNYHPDRENDDYVIAMGSCKGLENSSYCEKLKQQKEDNKKQLQESLDKHTKQ
ncbi:hypothetical protein E2K93_08905 [Thalassotalea sp. HSM 43]|uniref:hypothetical protein n=1 Tax=Thalassotalea sp. HSM 43 TaxID=2552945 RepID=UPI001080A77B|nr:hypothetical protein [Thalassotalea sp. HSM 43]QBY04500.1 hypothetical protein E2K93_08905 [Thalassotalea sp. HSM 43]